MAEYLGFRAAFWTVAAIQCTGTLMFLLFTRTFYLRRRIS